MKNLIIILISISLIISPLFSKAQTITTTITTYKLKIGNSLITLELSKKDNSNKIEGR